MAGTADAPPNGGTHAAFDDDRPPEGDGLAELRSLIVGPDHELLGSLKARLDDPAIRTADVSEVLPDAIALRGKDQHLARALAPTLEDAITTSVRRNPRPLADALFPIIGPAIRKAIAHTLSGMMESFNRTLELSLSWRAVQWRWTALRTGRSFAEVALLDTLIYRVEQVFLIHRESGLLLLHTSLAHGAVQDADQVSAMLTAIRDFVHDSFGGRPGLTLDGLRIGDLTVYIAQGPHAILAGVVRGTPPRELRVSVEEALEAIHFQHAADLESFNGDAAPFEAARPILEACLSSGYRPVRKGVSYGRWIVLGVLVLAAVIWLWSSYQANRQWRAYVDRLQATPGIVVVDASRRYHLVGLRDPLAPDPQAMLAASGIPIDRVDARWELYQAIDPAIVLERAKHVLRPPGTVAFQLKDGVLVAAGAAAARWIGESERMAPMIAGISRYDASGVVEPDLKSLREQIQRLSPIFEKGTTRLAAGQDVVVRQLGGLIDLLDTLARPLPTRVRVDVTGHTDSDGSDAKNQSLSQARAGYVLSVFRAASHPSLDFSARGVSGTEPLTSGASEADKRRNRRVSVHLVLPGDDEVRHP